MKAIAVEPQTNDRPAKSDDELVHITEPDDPDRSLCGLDVSDASWGLDGPICVVCEAEHERRFAS